MWNGNGNVGFLSGDDTPEVVPVRWLDFLRAFITTGYKFSTRYWNSLAIPHYIRMYWNQNFRSIFLYRFFMAHSIGQLLKIDNGNLSLEDAYSYLDPSEKTVWSYMLGMVFTKLIAEFQYDVVYLQNLDYAMQQNTVQIYPELSLRDERPDLIGQKIDGSWVVFEAKGRVGISECSTCRKLLEEATGKAKKIRSIQLNGISYTPNLCVGSVLINRQRLTLCACDPFPKGTMEVNIENYGKFIFSYYKLILDFLQEANKKKEISGIPFLVSAVETSKECEDVYMVGIYYPLYKKLMKVKKSEFKEQTDLITLLKNLSDELKEKEMDTEKVSIGKDGIIVIRRS